MIREILEKIDTPSTVISGVMSSDLSKAIKLLNKAGYDASVHQGEYIGIKGATDAKAKANMQAILDGKISKGFDISEACSKKKKKAEADGGYGDLGVVPSAPSNIDKEGEKKKKEKDLMIVDGEVKDELK